MPACTLHLLSLNTPIKTFLLALQHASIQPLLIARVIRWMITPTKFSTHLTSIPWELLILLPPSTKLPTSISQHIKAQWTVNVGIPSRLLTDFSFRNARLLYPERGDVVPRTGEMDSSAALIASDAQNLEMSEELNAWIHSTSDQKGNRRLVPRGAAVSMLNLLSFLPDRKESYLEYGKAFGERIGAKRGGEAKIVGTVIGVSGDGESSSSEKEGLGKWEEVAIAHYPSLEHFGDMIASADYQKVNHEFRVSSLRDTFILCTCEIGVEEGGYDEAKAKL